MESDKCNICEQERPCCELPLHLVPGHVHQTTDLPVSDKVQKLWAIGPVFMGNCHTIHQSYTDDEDGRVKTVLLGKSEDIAMARMNHVKSFLYWKLYGRVVSKTHM